MSIYEYSIKNAEGEDVSLESYRGKVILIVNTATDCGFTPQYAPLETIYEKYHEQGLEIIDIPCNQFGGQAPGTDEQIHTFCTVNFNTQFPQMKKSEVNGPNQIELYRYLKSQQGFKGFGEGRMAQAMTAMMEDLMPDYKTNDEIKWNFTKFLVDREGNVVERFEPIRDMEEIDAAIAALL